jgi:hypothetical protein
MRRLLQSANLVRTLVATSTAAVTMVTFASSASASAVGYAKVVGFCFSAKDQQICLPATTLGHFVQGSGRRVTREEASIQDTFGADSAGGNWCNWRIDWRYSDTEGRTYLVSRGSLHSRCTIHTSIGRVDTSRRTLKHYGKACADFYVSGTRRASQCHNITK